MINYSIIVPHKNIPKLLQRCIDSIPRREDVEIIIVDDNSNPEIVDFMNFPGQTRENTKVIFTKEGKGAGYARNIGMQRAIGKWVLFADADDYFLDELLEKLDKYINSHCDMILFKTECRMTNNATQEGHRQWLCTHWNNLIDAYNENNHHRDKLLYECVVPWGKMVKREFLVNKNISFEESKYSNDVVWSTLIHINLAKNSFTTCDSLLYCLTDRENSLFHTNNEEAFICRYDVFLRQHRYLVSANIIVNSSFNHFRYFEKAKEFKTKTLITFIKHSLKVNTEIAPVYCIERKLKFKYPYIYFLIIILQSIKQNYLTSHI